MFTYEDTIEWLNRAKNLDRLIEQDTRKLKELESDLFSIGGYTENEKVQASKKNNDATYVNKIIEKEELRQKLNNRIVKRYRVIDEVDEVINSLKDNDIVYVLNHRYINYKSFEKIGEAIHSSKSQAHKLHEKGVELVARKLYEIVEEKNV